MAPLMKLMLELHAQTHYARIKQSNQMVLQVVAQLSATPNGFVRVAEHDGELTGVLLGTIETYWWADQKSGARVATDLLFYSKRVGDGAKMMREMIDWAFSRPRVVKVETAISSGMIEGERADRFYERLGFQKRGSLYVMDHPKLREDQLSIEK